MSNAAHGLPMSFYGMQSDERARGVRSDVEESYIEMCVSIARDLLNSMRIEYEAIALNKPIAT